MVTCVKKLTIFSKNAVGQTGMAQAGTMNCQGQMSDTFCCLSFNVRLTPGPCEDPASPIAAHLNGVLQGTMEIIRRQDGPRGCFSGCWQLVPPAGTGGNVVLAAGQLSGTVGAGTHRLPGTPRPCEDCAVPDHFEGQFTGQVLLPGEFLGAEICASLAGRGPLQPHQQNLLMYIEGVLISCCPDQAAGTP